MFENSLHLFIRLTECDTGFTYELLRGLFSRNLVKYYDDGNSWMRNIVNTQDEQTHGILSFSLIIESQISFYFQR